ncbi:MAG: hypothetical protein GY870_14095 [archaeon]|nr:hypothetical protein [archaeon]
MDQVPIKKQVVKTPPRKIKRRKKNYINNKDFCAALVEWQNQPEDTQIPSYIAQCFQQIINNYGQKPNFSGYPFLDDMKGEAILHCVKYIRSFNVAKSENPFAYFTQIVYHAFLQCIHKEKKLLDFKFSTLREIMPTEKHNYTNIVPSNRNINGHYISGDGESLDASGKKVLEYDYNGNYITEDMDVFDKRGKQLVEEDEEGKQLTKEILWQKMKAKLEKKRK